MTTHSKIKQLLQETRKDKFFLYRKGDGTGFGNKLRGIHIAFLTSLLTKRTFICDYYYLTSYFICPPEINWNTQQLSFQSLTQRLIDPLHREDELHKLCTTNLDEYLIEDVIIHQQGNTWIHDFISNPHYIDKLNWLFDGDLSIKNTMGTIMSFLLSLPKPELFYAVEEVKNKLNWTSSTPKLGFQYRSNYLDDPNYFVETTRKMRDVFPSLIDNFIQTAKKWYPDNNFEVFLTTDEIGYTKHIAELLKKEFKVIYNETPVIHTQIETPTINPAIIDWFILGECDTIFSTFTSYSLLASARVNHPQKFLYKHDQNYSGDLTNEQYKVSI